MMDTVLQRGRWFGHKMKEADLISIHLQDESKEIFRQIAEVDRYLRLQIKQALYNGFTPMEVLIELRNSPFLQPTAKKKRSFLTHKEMDSDSLAKGPLSRHHLRFQTFSIMRTLSMIC